MFSGKGMNTGAATGSEYYQPYHILQPSYAPATNLICSVLALQNLVPPKMVSLAKHSRPHYIHLKYKECGSEAARHC